MPRGVYDRKKRIKKQIDEVENFVKRETETNSESPSIVKDYAADTSNPEREWNSEPAQSHVKIHYSCGCKVVHQIKTKCIKHGVE